MTDMRRTLLWVVFVASLFLLWDGWNKANGRASLFGGPVRQTVPAAAGAAPASAPSVAAATVAGGAAGAPASTAAVPAPTPAQFVTVTTDVAKATFSSIGGTLVRLELLKHKEQHERGVWDSIVGLISGGSQGPSDSNVVLFDRSAERTYVAESGLVDVPSPVTHLTPMQPVAGERELKAGSDELTVAFESADQGVKLVKTYTFHRGSYLVDVRFALKNLGTETVPAPRVYLQLKRDGQTIGSSGVASTYTGPALYTEAGKFKKISFEDIDKNKAAAEYEKTANDGWTAMVQHYFVAAWLHTAAQPRVFDINKDPELRLYNINMSFVLPTLAGGASAQFDSQLYAGPQEEKRLAELAPGLEFVKDYGWLTPLAKPLFWLLFKLHGVIGNWGWAIVALVVLLKIAFYWLNASAYKSMAKMKAINPRVMELRERLKDKPQQMQQEMMRIYREEKVNPLGGCLPIVVQMPFFIALYWVLLSTVEMRGAPWLGWIHDLSLRDPLYILPLLMTGTSLVQVALGAKPPDPVQARMMWIMPLAFSVMFFVFPSGLVLYWLTNNILSIAQQWFINKRLGVSNR